MLLQLHRVFPDHPGQAPAMHVIPLSSPAQIRQLGFVDKMDMIFRPQFEW